ncbi:DUF4286 family protein [Flavitalea flava]
MGTIVYNVTVKVRWNILEDWLAWELEENIPAVIATKQFDDYKFYRLLEQDEAEGPTFVVQYVTSTLERYEDYVVRFAPALEQGSREKWGDGYIAFRTIMSQV